MKNSIIFTLILLLNSITGFSQNQGRLTPKIKKEKLQEARTMSDIVPVSHHYLTQWSKMIDYVSIGIQATCEGEAMIAEAPGDSLSAEQLHILKTADLGRDLSIRLRFKYKDPANDNVGSNRKIKEMDFTVNVAPETEAEYPGGPGQMAKDVMEIFKDKIPAKDPSVKSRPVEVSFTVNEKGEVSDVMILRSSNDPELDVLALDAARQMPKWKPAENSKGIKVKQSFKFYFPFYYGGGC